MKNPDHTYDITNIPDMEGFYGGTEEFIHWGAAHDGGNYLYLTRDKTGKSGGGLLKIYCPLPGTVTPKVGILNTEPCEMLVVKASPNPFTSSIGISLEGVAAKVMSPGVVAIYDVKGGLVERWTPGALGSFFKWDAAGHPSGTYVINACIGNRTATKQIALVN
jgi:hypothetical protein